MSDSAALKVDRAAECVIELNELFRKERPFSYVIETNTNTRERAVYAKKNEAVIERAALICGDAIHNLRSALDHAYWGIVSPFTNTDGERRKVQFPFSETAARLDEAVKNRFADRVSPSFYQALLDLKPHGENGGNRLLYLIEKFDILDKHRLLIPTGDYKKLSSEIIRKQVPDFPAGVINCSFGQNRRDVAWNMPPINRETRRSMKIPISGILEQEINVPVDIIFDIASCGDICPVVPTLPQIVDVTRSTIAIIRSA